MALLDCRTCTTLYAVGLERCPHCGQPAGETVSLPADQPAATEPAGEPDRPRRRRKDADDG